MPAVRTVPFLEHSAAMPLNCAVYGQVLIVSRIIWTISRSVAGITSWIVAGAWIALSFALTCQVPYAEPRLAGLAG